MPPDRPIRQWWSTVWPPALAVVAVVAVWQAVADHGRYILPHPSAVLGELTGHPGFYLHSARVTLDEALIGLALGFVLGVGVAVAMSQLGAVERALYPLAVLLNVTPVVALAPGLVVAFGFGPTPKIIVTATICFFPALINTLSGLRAADPAVLEVLASVDASTLEVLTRVRFPSALPSLFVAARVCLPLSVTGAVVAELVAQGSTAGLGTVISQSAANSALPRVYAAVVCLGALGVALTLVVALLERRVLSWHPSRVG